MAHGTKAGLFAYLPFIRFAFEILCKLIGDILFFVEVLRYITVSSDLTQCNTYLHYTYLIGKDRVHHNYENPEIFYVLSVLSTVL